jgi:hypothetical protein
MLIVTDLLMFLVRLTVFFVAIFLLLSLVGDVNVMITSNEQSRAITQLAENYLEGNLTVSRGVFDAGAVRELDGNPAEPVHICSMPSAAEFFIYRGGIRERWARFGFSESGGTSREFPVWLQFDTGLVPAAMRLTAWPESAIADIGCAVERAWVYKMPQKTVEFNCPFEANGCVLYTDSDMFCYAEGYRGMNPHCRMMPGIKIIEMQISGGVHKLSATPIKKIEQGVSILTCDSPDIATGPGVELETVLLCEEKG